MYKGLKVQETMLLYGCGVESSNINYIYSKYLYTAYVLSNSKRN